MHAGFLQLQFYQQYSYTDKEYIYDLFMSDAHCKNYSIKFGRLSVVKFMAVHCTVYLNIFYKWNKYLYNASKNNIRVV